VGQCVFVSDAGPISLGDLLGELGIAQGKEIINIPMPEALVSFVAEKLLPSSLYIQLFENCETDISQTLALSPWRPKYSTAEGLHEMFSKSLGNHPQA